MELGKIQKLKVKELIKFGALLEDKAGKTVLLPNKEVEELKPGEEVEVFIYNDSEDRPIATRKRPKILLNEIAPLKVLSNTKVGAFLDWGLEKDLLMPFAEQITNITPNRTYLVKLYLDKSGRLAATSKIYDHLLTNSPYKKGDWVEGYVYNINPRYGAFIAVDNKYHGMINYEDMNESVHNGEKLKLRVVDITDDGKLRLSPIKKAYKEIFPDAVTILKTLKQNKGFIPYNDKSSPESIRAEFNISKGAFKKAVGYLLKNNYIRQTEEGIELIKNAK